MEIQLKLRRCLLCAWWDGVFFVCMTTNPKSVLARRSKYHVVIGILTTWPWPGTRFVVEHAKNTVAAFYVHDHKRGLNHRSGQVFWRAGSPNHVDIGPTTTWSSPGTVFVIMYAKTQPWGFHETQWSYFTWKILPGGKTVSNYFSGQTSRLENTSLCPMFAL